MLRRKTPDPAEEARQARRSAVRRHLAEDALRELSDDELRDWLLGWGWNGVTEILLILRRRLLEAGDA
jgi:hypothetical protein